MNERELYRSQVSLLIRIMPSVYRIEDFAVHGGTAINLFYRNLPRYSVDIDLTYIPIKNREESLIEINDHLQTLKVAIERTVPNIRIVHKPDVLKLMCTLGYSTVKIEVNGTKRGLIEPTTDMMLCEKAQKEFALGCKARVVSFGQLYGGKIAAALSRQHPRDLFDYKYMDRMEINRFLEVKKGLMFCLLGSDKPLIESLHPNIINQTNALENHFQGMSEVPFSYFDYEAARISLINKVNTNITEEDKQFLLSFEEGAPDWSKCCAGDLSLFPSVKWKLKNIEKLKINNPEKHQKGLALLQHFFEESF